MFDINVEIIKSIFQLKEEKNIKYTLEDCSDNKIYVFNNYDEFKNYFISNNILDVSDDIIKLCIFGTTKKGKVIALKKLCDYIITKYSPIRKYTTKEILEIHSRGNLTPWEKVEEWERLNICAPANYGRCYVFNNCKECLVNYASKNYEYEPNKDGVVQYNSKALRKKNN